MDRATPSAPPGSNPDGIAVALAVFAVGAYCVGLHLLVAERSMPALTLAMIVAPWIVAFTALASKRLAASGIRRTKPAAIASVLLVVAVAWVVAWRAGDRWTILVANADLVLYVENTAFFGWLSALFAISLASPREALVTRMARKVRRGDMPPDVVRYTRHVTVAWATFFAATIAVSSLLFFDGDRALWSLFVNLLIWPLLGAAFAVEYAVRLTVLRHVRHIPLWSGVRAFRERDLGEPDGRR